MSTPDLPPHQELPHGITLIDTLQERAGLAACYLVARDGEYAFIDTGTAPGVPRLLALLAARGIAREAVRYVIPTHVHLDHAGGVGALAAALPATTVLVHPRGARHLSDPEALWQGVTAVYGAETVASQYGPPIAVPANRIRSLADGETIPLGRSTLVAYDTPGHARHHLCLHDPLSAGLFTGDTFGLSYREFDVDGRAFLMPTTTPVQFEPEAWSATLDRLMGLAPERLYLTHFGCVDNVPALEAQLRAGLTRYQALARALNGADDRHARLRSAVLEETLTALTAHGTRLPRSVSERLLATDVELNAQGLGIWLDRLSAATQRA